MTEVLLPLALSFSTLADRRRTDRFLYYEIYLWKMRHAPENVHRFCDPSLGDDDRQALTMWIRSLEDRTSCQSLQILFSFSIPNFLALDKIAALGEPIVSAGAVRGLLITSDYKDTSKFWAMSRSHDQMQRVCTGTGYWEYLLQQRGLDVMAFDQNTVFPPEMRYTEIQTGGPALLTNFEDRILMLSWPDQEEDCTFSLECLEHYHGHSIVHIGELFGETHSANPWGQSTSRAFQLKLVEQFRCVCRVELPNWPGHMDSLTIWSRVPSTQTCGGADMKFVHAPTPRYFGWEKGVSS